jgi:hypothetical protein
MDTSFKSRSFKFAYWIMLIFLVGDTLDTFYRTISGYLGDGTTFPGVDLVLQPTTSDIIVFLILQCGVIYGIYLLYNLKKVGGYWFIGSNILFVIYAKIFGPIAEVGISIILPMLILYFGIYIILVIYIPWFYSDKFE